MRWNVWVVLAVSLAALPVVGRSFYRETTRGEAMATTATTWVNLLDEKQSAAALLAYDTPQRVDWHFIPKDERKGVQVKHMTSPQREAAHQLLQACLSDVGYKKVTTIMSLEGLLHELEGGKGANIRDPQRYYFTLFGKPAASGKWGLSIEGHHLSLNFVVENGKVVSSTPQFFAANPVLVKDENQTGIPVGTRVLAQEEQLAFELVHLLSDAQRADAIIDEKAPREIRAAGEAQPPQESPVGLCVEDMSDEQIKLLRKLGDVYLESMPPVVAQQRKADIEASNSENIYFAWAGSLGPGIGHYYRIQGDTFLIEFVNTQPDAAGNPASHIHCVWRDMRGDFAIPIK